MAPQVVELTLKAFLFLVGMPNAQIRVTVSEAKLWEEGHLVEPTSVLSMSPNADPALGPFCLFDPATGIGCGGDWCVEGSVEGAYASGIELGARVGRSPIMLNEGQSNPYGAVQFAAQQQLLSRAKRVVKNMEVVSAYSSDSRPSVQADEDFDVLEWNDAVRLQQLVLHHQGPEQGSTERDVICKTRMCPNEHCGRLRIPPRHDVR